jgi:hypothetical protein
MHGIKNAANPPKKPAINTCHNVLGIVLLSGLALFCARATFAVSAAAFFFMAILSAAVGISVNSMPLVATVSVVVVCTAFTCCGVTTKASMVTENISALRTMLRLVGTIIVVVELFA